VPDRAGAEAERARHFWGDAITVIGKRAAQLQALASKGKRF